MNRAPWVGLSLMTETPYLDAAAPLIDGGEVDVLEWSFDVGWGATQLPEQVTQWIDQFAQRERLLGHGVSFSLLSGQWTPRHEAWEQYLLLECQRRPYVHLSEHFGFMTAGDFHQGAPLPVPLTASTLSLGQRRLARLANIAGMPIGLENLAFAFCPQDVRQQGEFLRQLLQPTGGFVLLDLHNLYCQMCNFSVTGEELLDGYPLELVSELHISGGSWSESSVAEEPVRRDTHDDAVPEEVFAMLPAALERCPQVRAVIFERLGDTITRPSQSSGQQTPAAAEDPQGAARFQSDFRRLREIVEGCR